MIAKALGSTALGSTVAAFAFVAAGLATSGAAAGVPAAALKPTIAIEQAAKPAEAPGKFADAGGLSKVDHADSSKGALAGPAKDGADLVRKDDKPGAAGASGRPEPAAKPGSPAGESDTGK